MYCSFLIIALLHLSFFFFFNDTATTEIYTLSLHDALPILQTVGVAPGFAQPGSDTYRKWHDVLLAYRNGELPERGAIWLTYYPHIMVEWYPHVLTVSTLHPLAVDRTLNVVEFYYPEEIAARS